MDDSGPLTAGLPKPLCFIHVPKTGGISLSEAMGRLYRPEDILTENRFISAGLIEASRIQTHRDCFIFGHPTENILDPLAGRARLMTFLREPRSQTTSYYLQIISTPDALEHELAVRLGFKGFIRGNWTYAMSQTVTLAVAMSRDNNAMLSEIERRAWAVRNLLETMYFVGTLERITESYALLSEQLGLDSPMQPPMLNTAPERGPPPKDIAELRAQYDELRDDPATSYLISLEYETYRKAAAVLDRRLRKATAVYR